ncbi:MAG: site-specific integrase [Candidatus Aenigmatarchaeota archaeon]
MKKALAVIYLDNLRPKRNGKCSVKLKVTYNRKRIYFLTGIELMPNEFETIMYGKRKTQEQKSIYAKLIQIQNKALQIIDDLPIFTFDNFKEAFLENKDLKNDVYSCFDKYIERLKLNGQIGTVNSYECARNSLQKFKPSLTFAEVTPVFLKKYENWMLSNGNSLTTVGIYLRCLRAIFNLQNIDKSVYPFGKGKNKYLIPTGKNIKKALSTHELAQIYNYNAPEGSTMQMARDYWIFLYLCNGMNVKDFCLLKWKNIDGDILRYHRAKTISTNTENKPIIISLKKEALDIIHKWGVYSLNKENFIFPHINNNMTIEKKQAVIKQLIKTINKYMKRIAKELNIDKNVTTYYARHSFATVLKRSGVNVGMISELLGHSNIKVTENYLDSFEKEQIRENTEVLTEVLKVAK